MLSRTVGCLGSLQLTVAYFRTVSVRSFEVSTLRVISPSPPGRTSRVKVPRLQPQPGLTWVIRNTEVPVLRKR